MCNLERAISKDILSISCFKNFDFLYNVFNSFNFDDFSIKWDNAVPKPNQPVRLYLNCVQENTQGIALKS